MLEFH
jgi:hypothetical protein